MMENRVKYLQGINFAQLTLGEKIQIKAKGRHTPVLSIQQSSTSRSKDYTRQFNLNVYVKCEWLCGCEEANAFFCFPCLLFGGDPAWTKGGVTDLRHLPQKLAKHEHSAKHMHNIIDLSFLGKQNAIVQADTNAITLSTAEHNAHVKRNRDVLSKIINCVRFCGKFELSLNKHDENTSSQNPGVFRGLVDFASELDPALSVHFKTTTVFKGTYRSIQNDLLESILEVCRRRIKEEVQNAEFLAVLCDETMSVHDGAHSVIVLRYEAEGKPVERFWGFFNPVNQSAEALSAVLLQELQTLISECPHKLIALSGVSQGVQTRIKEVYTNAHLVHCYTHDSKLVVQKATSQDTNVRAFFNSLSGIPEFFCKSPERMAVLDDIASHQIPRPSVTRWNFETRTVNAVHKTKYALIECCSKLEASHSQASGATAAGIKRMLKDPEFNFWLQFFSRVMPHLDIMFAQLQSANTGACRAMACLEALTFTLKKLRDEYDAAVSPIEQKKRKRGTDTAAAAQEVCDAIVMQCRERFTFNNHLEAIKLLSVKMFPVYATSFPTNELEQAGAAYPTLEKDTLRTELYVLYAREGLCKSESLTNLLKVINENNLQSVFSNTIKLIKILITTPVPTTEAERCLSTFRKIKTFLRNTTANERLSALAMLSIENEMITEMRGFNERVTDHFATSKGLRIDFLFK